MFPFDDVIMVLQDVTKPLPEPIFIYYKYGLMISGWGQFNQQSLELAWKLLT